MPSTGFGVSLMSPRVNVAVDTGNAFLNHTLDGFIKIGTVALAKTAAEETYDIIKKGSISSSKVENSLKKMCKEGAYWGTIAGVYVGMEYGVVQIRGTRDWKNATLGGALTGALVSACTNNSRDKIVLDAIAGGAIATAAEFINSFN